MLATIERDRDMDGDSALLRPCLLTSWYASDGYYVICIIINLISSLYYIFVLGEYV